jgi:hypothetical protein
MTLRLRRSIAVWIALSGMALNALWPVIANAKPAVPAGPSEICGASGLKHAAGGAPAGSRDDGLRALHCPLCPFNAERSAAIFQSGQLPLPSAPAGAQVFVRGDASRPETGFQPAALPRAPPILLSLPS